MTNVKSTMSQWYCSCDKCLIIFEWLLHRVPLNISRLHKTHDWHIGSARPEVHHLQWCSSSGAIAPVPIFLGGAPLQFLFLLFLVIFALILQKLKIDLLNYLVIRMLCIQSCISYVNVWMDTSIVRMTFVILLKLME